jgi:AcrR family transcriptional regulator
MVNAEERILSAAMKVFAKEGYEGATTKKIANEAGVNEVTILRNFKTKKNLLEVVIDKNQHEALETLDSIIIMEKHLDPIIGLETIGKRFMEFLEERMEFLIILMTEGRKNPEISPISNSVINKFFEHLSEYFTDQIEKGNIINQDPKMIAFAFVSYIFYGVLSEKLYKNQLLDDKDKALREFVNTFLTGNFKT